MLYAKPEWSCVSFSEGVAPVAKMQLTGAKLILTIPYQSVSASLAAKSTGIPPTQSALANHFLGMSLKDFIDSGGMCAVLGKGDFVWVPECTLMAQYNLHDSNNERPASTSLSWVALSQYHCTVEGLTDLKKNAKSVLDKCCQPSEKWAENQLQAHMTVLSQLMFFIFEMFETRKSKGWFRPSICKLLMILMFGLDFLILNQHHLCDSVCVSLAYMSLTIDLSNVPDRKF